jgi:hypothetical protein
VSVEELAAAPVAQLSRALGRPNDIAEQDGGEHALPHGFMKRAGEKALDPLERGLDGLPGRDSDLCPGSR